MTDGRKNFLLTQRGERIEQADLQHAVETSQLELALQHMDGFTVGQDPIGTVDQPRAYVISGFAVSTQDTPPRITVERGAQGAAIMSVRREGVVQNGCLLTSGDVSKTIDISALANGVYGVYIRFELREDEYGNRLFWDPTAVPPAEFPQNIPTRLTENWSMTVELVAPGPEWMLIAEITKSGTAITTNDDKRNFFFEGRADLVHDPENEWGSAADRLDGASRPDQGIFGLRRFVRAMQSQLARIIHGTAYNPASGHGWFTDVTTAPINGGLRDLEADKLERSGSNTITGVLRADGNETRDLGLTGTRFKDFFTQNVVATTNINATNIFASTKFEGVDHTAYRYGTPQTFTKSLCAGDFVVGNPAFGNIAAAEVRYAGFTAQLVAGSHGGVLLSASAGNPMLEVIGQLMLPQGAVITGCILEGDVNTANCDIAVSAVSHVLNGASKVSLMTTAGGGSGSVLNWVDIPNTLDATAPFTVPVNQNLTIDNATYRYLVAIRTTTDGDTLLVSEVRFTYTVAQLKP